MISIRILLRLIAIFLASFFFTSCIGAQNSPSTTPSAAASTPVPNTKPELESYTPTVAASTPAPTAKPELESYFQGYTGAFVLLDYSQNLYTHYNPGRCAERFLPASTFKIMNSLIGLETGVIPDESFVIKWDGLRYENQTWNKDQTMKSAFQDSVVWYYQELARRVGSEKIQHYVDQAGYGNQDISGPVDSFWLAGNLRISADEQVGLLERLYNETLPFSKRSINIVKEMMVLEKGQNYQLSGKTGSGQIEKEDIGWFVGYIEKENQVYFFAANIGGSTEDVNGQKAKEITLNILRSLELLP
jgi:beta-lactamase class D